MSESRAKLARRITWHESKQSYLTMRLLVDRGLVDDGYRAYAYFRWADDVVDKTLTTKEERVAFIQGQRSLIEGLYAGHRPADLQAEETLVADLIQHDRGYMSRLRSYIENFLAIIEFDAERKGRRITEAELGSYVNRLALAVTDAIQYFIKNGHPYPEEESRLAGARAAHITHMLRDLRKDLPAGYSNIPEEYLEKNGIRPEGIDSPAFLGWVKARVETAREEFRQGKVYIDGLDVLRTKIAAHWYCARFEHILDTIEKDGYHLRLGYAEKHEILAWLRMIWVAARVTAQHAISKMGKATRSPVTEPKEVPFLMKATDVGAHEES